ncbi:MAG: hypothetical protein A2666_05380 [Parcubacteria group bacterium RIFCSPHIGHO2_01_FULL_47_10b]|nr:MAG: hypothetical protein A2666_05380 [Parcubacteria group bacterium RIFCSPHIGHO2_01_FULL_47_10b]
MEIRHVLNAKQFDPAWLLNDFLPRVSEIKLMLATPQGRAKLRTRLSGMLMYLFFAEESTRTRFSFATAAINLGMALVWCENGKFSSLAKGESWEETVEVLLGYLPDILVSRHPSDNAADIAARISDLHHGGIPTINAGSGRKHHPTQSLLDLFTILELLNRLDNLTIAIGADVLFSRTARSLAYLFSKFASITLRFVTPAELAPPSELLEHLTQSGTRFECTTDVNEGIRGAHVVYWGRLQAERVETAELRKQLEAQYANFQIDVNQVALMEPNTLLMHPMPISDKHEITLAVRNGNFPQFKVYEQARNGLPVRMALLLHMLENRLN